MALDSIAVRALCFELKEKLTGGRIDKIHQPERDELTISVRTYTESYKLVVCASPSNARIHLTDSFKDNPKTAPMFCMLLRKHLGGGKIIDIIQPDFERIVRFDIEARNELGDLVMRHLIAELTGRNSNIILTDENGKIIEAARHVDFTQSSFRQIMPSFTYIAPPKQEKIAILDEDSSIEIDFSDKAQNAFSAVMSSISGISPVLAREAVWKATSRTDTKSGELTEEQKTNIIKSLLNMRQNALSNKFSPCLITETQTDRLLDFSAFKIGQYEGAATISSLESMCTAISDFYYSRALKERIKGRTADLSKLISTNLERLSKKLVIQQKTLKDAENKDKFRKYGDLITASSYMISVGMDKVTLTDYFEPDMPEITIPLSPLLSPIDNAQKYYKKYQKAKTAETEVKKQLENTLCEIEYLESTLTLLENSTELSDINAIRTELAGEGYLKLYSQKKQKEEKSLPHHFISSDGFDIYIGKNNLQNDTLTLKFANSSDIWFHTKKIHGSHTIIKLGIDKDIPKQTMLEAASLAAYYSKARFSNQVPVDYTAIKNVKKPRGAKPGMVIYDSYNTIYTTPKSPEELHITKYSN